MAENDRARTDRKPSSKRPNISPRLVAGVLIVALALWFVLINNRSVRIHFWIPWAEAPMWFVLGATFLAGAVTAWLLGRRKK
ncbi:LapA family protein [Streptomyces sp. NBC_00237]|uniref:LapA family protein n=1 Tax=Streptomyces sp. NBC_00237 TaxID=2975687 RepID=UPI002254E54F|nr:LapA family protein [Streptomyces sp. NBC_00237]MCX5206371.1 LapA family protein [Streptomyces sp. NBC_00237]